MALVAGEGVIEQGGIGTDLLQRAADQVFGTLADQLTDAGARNGRLAEFGQHGVERQVEIAHGVDQGAIEIDHDGLHRQRLLRIRPAQGHHAHASALRMSPMTAA